jgi:hypothetical protein
MLQIQHKNTNALKNDLAPLAWAWQSKNSLDKVAFSKMLNSRPHTPNDVPIYHV